MSKKDPTKNIDPAQLEAMKAMVAKMQGDVKVAVAKKQEERQKQIDAENEAYNKQRELERAQREGVNIIPATQPVVPPDADKATHFFLDDKNEPKFITWVPVPQGVNWRIIRSYDEFVTVITTKGVPKYVSFDSDLGPGSKSGAEAAKWLKKYCKENKKPLPDWGAHSATITGRQSIENVLL